MSLRVPFDFDLNPWSIFIFQTYKYENHDEEENYFFVDSYQLGTFAIRMNGIGVIISYGENGVQKEFLGEELSKYQDITLHPIQFNELYAYIAYTRILLDNPTTYVICDQNGKVSVSMAHVRSKKGLLNYNPEIFARFLYNVWKQWGFSYELIFYDTKLRIPRTYLLDGNGVPLILPQYARFIKLN